MKKLLLSITMLCMAFFATAQWVDDPATNTFINSTHTEYNEIIQSRCTDGSFYIQFCNMVGGDWSPKLLHVSKDGEPLWDEPVYLGQSGATWSQGVSMAATADGCAVSHFASTALGDAGGYAFKVNASGDIVWGPLRTSDIDGGRCEVIADEDGGVWVSSTDFSSGIHVRHIAADGTMGNDLIVPLGAQGGGRQKMVLAPDGGITMPYQSYDNAQGWTAYDQTIWVAKINANGELVSNNQMMNTTSIQAWQEIQCIPDGQGGGYAWIQHCGGEVDAFNVYVMHFTADGICTTYAQHPLGVQICPTDAAYYRFQADGTADVLTGDLILAFRETDSGYEAYDAMKVVRVSQSGEIINGQGGTVIVPTAAQNLGQFRVACAPDRSITMIYSIATTTNNGVMKAVGTDSDFSILWAHDFNSNPCVPEYKEAAEGAYEYADGQFVLFFQDSRSDVEALYGQNIQPDGTMGVVTPNPCAAPTNLYGEPYEDGDEYGAFISWGSAGDEESYNVYRGEGLSSMELIGNTTSQSYYDNLTGEEGGFFYIVRAVCETGESDPATTASGYGYVIVNVVAPEGCDAPTNLAGEYVYNEDGTFGASLSWSATDAESYNVYRGLTSTDFELIGNVKTNAFYEEISEINTYYYMVKAVCESGESEPATTAAGDEYIAIVITGISENAESQIAVYQNGSNIIINGMNIQNVEILNVAGQVMKRIDTNVNTINISDLNAGMYVVNVRTNGNVVSKKVVIR